MSNSRSRFRWLWGNNFYSETPLTGFAFISAAKHTSEVVLWYLVLVVFTAYTGREIFYLFSLYATAPTETNSWVGYNASNDTLPTFQLAIEISLDEFDRQIDFMAEIYTWTEDQSSYVCFDVTNLGTSMSSDDINIGEGDSSEKFSMVLKQMQTKLANFSYNLQDFFATIGDESGETVGPVWEQMLDAIGSYSKKLSVKEVKVKQLLHKYASFLKPRLSNTWQWMPIALQMLEKLQKEIDADLFGIDVAQLVNIGFNRLSQNLWIQTNASKIYLHEVVIGQKNVQLVYGIEPDTDKLSLEVYSARMAQLLHVLHGISSFVSNAKMSTSKSLNSTMFDKCLPLLDVSGLFEKFILKQYRSTKISVFIDSQLLTIAPFHQATLIRTPAARMKSETDDCYEHPMFRCLADCKREVHLTSCSCLPWDMIESRTENTVICSQKCPQWSEAACNKECEKKIENSCDLMLQHVSKLEKQRLHFGHRLEERKTKFYDPVLGNTMTSTFVTVPYVDWTLPLASIQIESVKILNHPIFTTEYAMSSSYLFSSLAGVAEFWLGFNILALVHLMFYFCVKHDASPETTDIIEQDIVGLKKRVKNLRSPNKEEKGSFWWTNRWFETTPLSTFAFINAAGKFSHVLFWYTVLIVFSVVTVYNVNDVVTAYLSNPIRTTPRMLNTGGTGIPNLTLTLKSSEYEFWLMDQITSPGELLETLLDWCSLDKWKARSLLEVKDRAANAVWGTTNPGKFMDELLPALYSRAQSDWGTWLTNAHFAVQEQVQKLDSDDFLLRIKDLSVWSDELVLPGSDGTQCYECTKTALGNKPFVLLKALSEGQDWSSLAHKFNYITYLPYHTTTLEDSLATYAGSVHYDTQSYIDAVAAHVESQVVSSSGTVHLTDWDGEVGNPNHYFTFRVVLPQNTQKVQLQFYNYNFARFMLIFDFTMAQMNQFFSRDCSAQWQNSTCANRTACLGGPTIGIQLMRLKFYDLFFSDLLSYLDTNVDLNLDTNGMTIRLASLHEHKVKIKPVGQFVSHLDNCYEGNLDTCVEECRANAHSELCACVPWYLRHATTDKSAMNCQQFCKPAVELPCYHKCGKLMENACHSVILKADLSSSTDIRHYTWSHTEQQAAIHANLPIISVVLDMAENMHPEFTVEYEMGQHELMAHVGALLELYLGLNIVGLVHLGVYIVKQFHHMTEDSRTKRKIARSCARSTLLILVILAVLGVLVLFLTRDEAEHSKPDIYCQNKTSELCRYAETTKHCGKYLNSTDFVSFFDGSCLVLVDEPLDWRNATRSCGRLVTTTTAEEVTLFQKILHEWSLLLGWHFPDGLREKFWIGLYEAVDKRWFWSNGVLTSINMTNDAHICGSYDFNENLPVADDCFNELHSICQYTIDDKAPQQGGPTPRIFTLTPEEMCDLFGDSRNQLSIFVSGVCLLWSGQKESWADASWLCWFEDGRMLHLPTQGHIHQFNQAVVDKWSKYGVENETFWLDAGQEEGVWTWLTTGDAVDSSLWKQGHPKEMYENEALVFIAVGDGQISSTTYEDEMHYLCGYDII